MILADSEIQRRMGTGEIVIDPYPDDIQFQSASVDVRLDSVEEGFSYTREMLGLEDAFCFPPGMLRIGCIKEYIEVPTDLVGKIDGRSTWARKGLVVHLTAGFIDPGFKGQVTLEIINLFNVQVYVPRNARIAQLYFETTLGKVRRPYGHPELRSKYQGQRGPTKAKEDVE